MNLTQLRTFVAVVDSGSFSSAARDLGLSQPAVTMQVQALESALGQQLVDRSHRRIGLTEAGEVLLPYARRVLDEVDIAKERLEDVSDRVAGRLAIAASTTPGQYVLPKLLGAFLRKYPDVEATLRVYDTAEVVDQVLTGRAHIGVTGARPGGAKLEFTQMGTDTLVLVAPNDKDVGPRPRLTAIVHEPWIMREHGSGTRAVVEEALRGARIDPASLDVVMELDTSEAIVSAVEGGMGVGVVSRWVAEKAIALGTVTEVRADPFPLQRPLFVVLPKGRLTRAAAGLLSELVARR